MRMWKNAIIRVSDLQIHVQTKEQHDKIHSNGSWTKAALKHEQTVRLGVCFR